MLDAFQQFIEKNKLCSKSDKILITLSGGLDSVVLLALFQESDYDISIAHCNFKLRGEESDADEDFVRSLASERHVEIFVKSCDAAKYAEENKLTIQEAARDLRYAWFEEVSAKKSFNKIAVAHHADDQIETLFINLFRGSGTAGLKGMPLERGKIIRPLLFASRADIEKFASENKLKFREDSSNTSDKYLRNKIRHQLIPVMEKVSPQAKKSIAKSLDFLQEDALILHQLIDKKKDKLLIEEGINTTISINDLMELQPLDVWLFYLLKDFNFLRKTTNDLAFILQNDDANSSGKIFHSETHQLLIDREYLILQKKKSEVKKTEFFIQKTDFKLILPVNLQLNIEEYVDDYSFEDNPTIAYFDADKLQFPLTIRKWKQGDRFIPFGMNGSKLLSDYFIDKKIDRFTKEHIWLLLSGNTIIWIIGHRASDTFRVEKECSRIMKIWVLA